MRGWTRQLGNRLLRRPASEEQQVVEVLGVQPSLPATSKLEQISVESWLDHKAQELNGDWSLASLGGLFRGDDAADRQTAAAMLQATEELSLEFVPDELYSTASVRVRTLEGRIVGQLESSVAETVSRQIKEGGLVRCFVYRVTLNERRLPSSILLALMSWAFCPTLT